MTAILQKALKDSLKEKSCIIGSRKVLSEMSKCKLVLVSDSASEQISRIAHSSDIPLVHVPGTSVHLSKLCGRQYRISALSFTKITAATVKAIQGEARQK